MKNSTIIRTASVFLCGAFVIAAGSAWAAPKTQNLYAKLVWVNPTTGSVNSSQGNASLGRIPMWGFATTANGTAQVPGPQIDVAQNQYADGLVITVYNLLTNLPTTEPVSLVIPGLNGNTDIGNPVMFPGTDPNYPNRVQSLVRDVPLNGSRTYTWAGPLKVGTYAYHSGTHPALQVQMGLYGMVTVKSNNTVPYPGYPVAQNREVPVIFSEVDRDLHWAVHTNGYGPGKAISSTIHSEPGLFLINGRTYSSATPRLSNNGKRGDATLFRMINFCWDSRIPVLAGPLPGGSGGNYLTAIAEDANLYPFAKSVYAPNLAALKTMDLIFTPPLGSGSPWTYTLYDHRLGLSNPSQPDGGMYAQWQVTN